MGYYIQVPQDQDKAQQLCDLYGALDVTVNLPAWTEIPEDKALVCVVRNLFFDAAALVYGEQEFEAFKSDFYDPRPRNWLLMDKELAHRLAGYHARTGIEESH